MTFDLTLLVAAVGLQWVLIMLAAAPRMGIRGIPWSLGNRDDEGKPVPVWAHRLQRASDNLQENLILFAVLVLVVHVAGEADTVSAVGASVFVGARAAHAVLYGVGIPVVRTLSWFVGVVGMAIVAAALVI